jgi:hypothetical protein
MNCAIHQRFIRLFGGWPILTSSAAVRHRPFGERPNNCAWFGCLDDRGRNAASAGSSQATPYVAGRDNLHGSAVALEKPARAVLAVIHVVGRSEAAKAMARRNVDLAQAAA